MPTDTTRGPTDVNIALLRGINVGGKNRLPMKDLAAMFVDAGCDDVRTYIQSGNVLFRTDPTRGEDIASLISASIFSRFGYQIPVVTRAADEIRETVQANPFVESCCWRNHPTASTSKHSTRIARHPTSSPCGVVKSISTVRMGSRAASSRTATSTLDSRPSARCGTGRRCGSCSSWPPTSTEQRRVCPRTAAPPTSRGRRRYHARDREARAPGGTP